MKDHDKKEHIDHIFPKCEGGTDEEWNKRSIPASENLSKGSQMPDLDDILDSSNPGILAAKIDQRSLEGFSNHRNSDRGFGGLRRR